MPKLLAERETVRIDIPYYPEDDPAYVVIFKDERLEDSELATLGQTTQQMTIATLAKTICEWNYTDAQGNVLDITYDNVKKLPARDYRYISTKAAEIRPQPELSEEDKKKLESILPQNIGTIPQIKKENSLLQNDSQESQ